MTRFSVVISKKGRAGIADGFAYYDGISQNLGIRFLDEVGHHLNILTQVPYFRKRYGEIRMLPLNTFPYCIHYKVDDSKELVIILAVINTHRDSSNWPGAEK